MTTWKDQVRETVLLPNNFEFKPHWDEVHPNLCWAWLMMGAHFAKEFGEEDVATYLEGEFVWAYSAKKPTQRNERGEYAEGVKWPSLPYRHFPKETHRLHIHVPLGIDYRTVLVEKPVSRANQVVCINLNLSLATMGKLEKLTNYLGLSREDVIALAMADFHEKLTKSQTDSTKKEGNFPFA